MDPVNRLLIEAECNRLCMRFARCLDNGDFEAMFALFTPDGVFDRVGQVLRGHEEMRAAFGARPPGITSRHVVTNIDFLEVSDEHVEAHIYNLSFHAVGDAGSSPLTPLTYATENARFLDFHDHYRLTDQGWRFASRTAGVVFVPRDWQE
jgi:3-phenylpropionate/cinnamic acid dioxygenase small subunit